MERLKIYFSDSLYISVDLKETQIFTFEKWYKEKSLFQRLMKRTFSINDPDGSVSVFDRKNILFYRCEKIQ